MGRILITGGAGFIGSHLADALLDRGHEVWAIDVFDDYYAPSLKRINIAEASARDGFRLLEGDLCDRAWLESAIGGESFDIVYHLAARAGISGSVKNPLGYARMNVDATLTLVEVLLQGPPTRLAYASSSSVYGNFSTVPFSEADRCDRPISPYSAFKRGLELMLFTYHHLHQLPVMCLRFFTVYGPRQRPEMAIAKFVRMIERGETIQLYGDGTSERDYTYVDDIVAGALGAMDAMDADFGYDIVNLGGAQRTPLAELVRVIERVMGQRARVEHLPARPMELHATWADVTKAREVLGFDPQVSIEEGVARYWTWYQAHREQIDAALATQPA